MHESIEQYMQTVGQQARQASAVLASASTQTKNHALSAIYTALENSETAILAANQVDMTKGRNNNLDSALLDRLELTPPRFKGMLQGLKDVIGLLDPIGEITDMAYRPSGIQIGKMRVPLGVVGMIYESRPNVTLEAASLALKSGNAIILRGGSEALESNKAIAEAIQYGLKTAGLPETAVQVINTPDRAAVGQLITMSEYVDVIVPRGGKGLIERISAEARVPVIKHLDGNCHVYVDDAADPAKVVSIVENAKTQRYGTCNTAESLLVARKVAKQFLPDIGRAMIAKGVEMRVDSESRTILAEAGIADKLLREATESDWGEEYLAPIIAIKIVADLDEAITHINTYSSGHIEAIISENHSHAMRFLREIDSASVMINASTRFADGFEYGLGAEIGISTDKIHARGPVGLEGLTSQKWIVFGNGEIRS